MRHGTRQTSPWSANCPALRFHHPLVVGALPQGLRWGRPNDENQRKAESPPLPLGPAARDEKISRLEAVLFVAGEPLSGRRLAQFAGLADGTQARTLIRQLNQFYDRQGTAFRVEDVAGGFQLLTRPKFSKWLRRLFPTPVEMRLSGPAMETLAVVAYRQPVMRAEIEAIRGVQCGEMLRQLLERDLIRISGRAEELGRPFVYATTRRFLQLFGLRHLDDLPRAEFLRSPSTSPRFAAPSPTERNNESITRSAANEESEVTIADLGNWGAVGGSAVATPLSERDWLTDALDVRTSEPRAEDDDEDDDFDDDEDDLDDEDDDFDDDEEDDDDWEEVDDEDEDDEDEEDDDEDDDWEEDDDEDWDDDEDDDDDWEEEEGDEE